MYEVGQTLLGYRFTKAESIEEISCVYYELEHIASGATVIHIAADDPENLFSLCFKTYPESSNGVAHILEHTVLCGSRRFPVKDPFFSMTRRSLNTFMNAMTGADFTCYPAASQIEKDFYNLFDVYIDACFFPHLKKESFLQEGHRLEFTEGEDPSTPLQYKGIVFNEMKGAMSNVDARMWQAVSKHLVPDLTYAHNSGGDPAVIPELTYEQLLSFHRTFYAPSRCIFFFYGNLPIENHLAYLEKKVLSSAEKLPPLPPLPLQKRFEKPLFIQEPFPSSRGSDEPEGMLTISWLTAPIADQKDVLALQVLDSILMETDASPLRRALLESRLCTQADGALDTEMSEIPYLVVCKGVRSKDVQKLSDILFESLEQVAKDGIPPEMIEAAVHQLEFQRSEITGDYGPYGLTLFFRSALAKQHGAVPEESLMIHRLFKALLLEAQNKEYFPNIIRKYFLENPHRVTVEMVPDEMCAQREKEAESAKLRTIETSLSDEEKQQLVEQAQRLETFQQEEEPLECLPKLERADIPEDPVLFPLHESKYDALTLFHHDTFTNHILYVDVLFDMPEIHKEELPYLQLLISLLPELGTGTSTYAENLHEMNLYTGGISSSISLFEQWTQPDQSRPAFILRGKSLARNSKKLIELLRKYAFEGRFDEKERIRELILQIHTHLEQKLTRSPMGYAMQMAHASFSSHATIQNNFSGLPYLLFIRNLVKNIETNLSDTCEKLGALYARLTSVGNVDCVISSDQALFEDVKDDLTQAFNTTHEKNGSPWSTTMPPQSVSSHCIAIESPVAFTAQAFRTVVGSDPLAPALSVATSIFDNTTLHRRIREQGGAYGSGCSYNPSSGYFHFYAFRDPHLKRTEKAFREAIEKGAEGAFSSEDIDEAVFSLIQSYDSPCSPGSRAMAGYTHLRTGRDFALRKQYRQTLLSVTKEDVIEAIKKHLLPEHQNAVFISLCGKDLATKEAFLRVESL